MLFTSVNFIIFLIVVFALYWALGAQRFKLQNALLLLGSYIFYGFWNWHFCFLLFFSTALDYCSGLKIYRSNTKREKKSWLTLSVIVNLSILGFFKYFNFFLSSLGFHTDYVFSHIVLPLGISFYTFHGLSYVFDVYNNKRPPTNNFVQYGLFVSFFPLLVAGPIERATHLLPQIEKPRNFDYTRVVDGLRQMLWGFFKKLVIADNCAAFANPVFNNSSQFYGLTLVLAAVMFSFQIYCDFSGYADIALGTARLLGFDLVKNFSFPYFSRSVAEFWRRWNISLSSWFRDYIYVPLGGGRVKLLLQIRNVFIVFLLSGLWHGANWTFVIWGGLNALFILPSIIFKTNRNHLDIIAKGRLFPSIKEFFQMGATFTLITFAWIFFRAATIHNALVFVARMFVSTLPLTNGGYPKFLTVLLPAFLIMEWTGRQQNYAIEKFGLKWPRLLRWSFYTLVLFCIGLYMDSHNTPFIYFQF